MSNFTLNRNKISRLDNFFTYFYASPFNVINQMTRYRILHHEKFHQARKLAEEKGVGLLTVSNHLSMFDDPVVQMQLLGIKRMSSNKKIWWSTPCADNFTPDGESLKARLTRGFSRRAKMIPMKRNRSATLVDIPALLKGSLADRYDDIAKLAEADGLTPEAFVQQFVTPQEELDHAGCGIGLNQEGMIEACVRVRLGEWVHIFPEGGRSRTIDLRKGRKGAGKIAFHNPDAIILPFCFYGLERVLPVGAKMLRPFQKAFISIGDTMEFSAQKQALSMPESYQQIADEMMLKIADLRDEIMPLYMPERQKLFVYRGLSQKKLS